MVRMLKAFAYQEGMTSAQARIFLNSPIDQAMTVELVKRARATGDPVLIRKVEAEAFKLTYSRRKALKQMLEINYRKSAKELSKGVSPIASDISKEAYLRTTFEIQRTMHVGFEVGGISERMVNKAVSGQFGYTNATYMTARAVGDKLETALFEGLLKGENLNNIGMELAKVSDVVPWKAKGIARTAVTEIANDTEIETLKENGIKKYRYLATLDETTCPICGGIDNEVFDIEDKKTGVNCPPMHPNCRCTTTVAFTETALKNATRSAKDKNKKWVKVPSGMNYSQWKEKFYTGN